VFIKCDLFFIVSLSSIMKKQGLSMGEMLTVNFRQPSYEFTFNVGIDLLF
jgi:hypothetical protein